MELKPKCTRYCKIRSSINLQESSFHSTDAVIHNRNAESLHWPLLQDLRQDKDLEMFYKVEKGMVNIAFPEELVKRHTNTRGHKQRYIQTGGSINAYQHSFFVHVRTAPKWNALPAVAVEAISLAAFKNEISACK